MALNSIRAIFRLGLCLRLGSCCWGLPARGQTLNNNAIGTSTINVIDIMNINIQLEICQPLQSIERVRSTGKLENVLITASPGMFNLQGLQCQGASDLVLL